MRDGADDAGPSRSMSPLPTRRSAPCWSRITRLSVADDTANARRAGTLALMTPVMTFDRRALRGDHEVDADGAGHLGDAADRVLDVAGRDHHQVGSSSTTMRMNGSRGYSRTTSPVGDTSLGRSPRSNAAL